MVYELDIRVNTAPMETETSLPVHQQVDIAQIGLMR